MTIGMKDIAAIEFVVIAALLVLFGMGWIQAAWFTPVPAQQDCTANVTKSSTLCGLELCANDTLFCTTVPLKDFDDCNQLMYQCTDARPGSRTWYDVLGFSCIMRFPGNNTLKVPTCSCTRTG